MSSTSGQPDQKTFPSSDCLLRLTQIIGQSEITPEQAKENRRAGIAPVKPRHYIKPIVPVSKSAWLAGVKAGTFPQPIKLGKTTVWRESDVLALFKREDEGC